MTTLSRSALRRRAEEIAYRLVETCSENHVPGHEVERLNCVVCSRSILTTALSQVVEDCARVVEKADIGYSVDPKHTSDFCQAFRAELNGIADAIRRLASND